MFADFQFLVRHKAMVRMLALSFSLHLALLIVLQPARVKEISLSPPIVTRLLTVPEPEVPRLPPPPSPVNRSLDPPTPDRPSPPRPVTVPVPQPTPAPAEPGSGNTAVLPAEPATVVSPPSPTPMAPVPSANAVAEPVSTLPKVPVIEDTTWYSARQLDRQPRPLAVVNPAYPREARRRGIEGSVRVRLRIDEFGMVREAEVEEADPPGVFDAAVLEAYKSARFAPAQKNQRPVRALVQVRVLFQLEN